MYMLFIIELTRSTIHLYICNTGNIKAARELRSAYPLRLVEPSP